MKTKLKELTPVEWLEERILNGDPNMILVYLYEAKEMEKRIKEQVMVYLNTHPKWVDEWGNTDWRDTGEMGG